jgi:hypothetical protein
MWFCYGHEGIFMKQIFLKATSKLNSDSNIFRKILQFFSPFFSYFNEKNVSIIYATDQFVPDEVLEFVQPFSSIFLFPNLLSENSFIGEKIHQCQKNKTIRLERPIFLSNISPSKAIKVIFERVKFSITLPIKVKSPLIHDIFSRSKCEIDYNPSPHFLFQNFIKFEFLEIPQISNHSKGKSFLNNIWKQENLNESIYVSIILVGRNDQYAQNSSYSFQTRTEYSLKSIERCSLQNPLASFEIIFVDYGSHYSNLHKVLSIPRHLKPSIRFIIVPVKKAQEINQKVSSQVEFQEYVAKNIGLLHSKGEFILVILNYKSNFRKMENKLDSEYPKAVFWLFLTLNSSGSLVS